MKAAALALAGAYIGYLLVSSVAVIQAVIALAPAL